MKTDNTLGRLVADVGGPEAAGRLLGVHRSTVYRWLRGAVPIPRASYRALYAASSWGRGDRRAWSVEAARLAGARCAALERELADLRALVARLVKLSDTGAANAPLFKLVRA